MTGQRFGKLTALKCVRSEYVGKEKRYIWLCQCDCGKTREIWSRFLTKGIATSCNSLECKKSGFKKGNKYIFKGDVVIGYDSKDNEFYIDLDDYDKVSKYTWTMNNLGYFITKQSTKEGGKVLLLHRYIMGTTNPSIVVDHINHCRHDNRENNLREVTVSENSKNIIRHNNNIDPYIKAIQKFIVIEHPEFGEFKTAKEASDFYQNYLIKQIKEDIEMDSNKED